RIPVTGHQSRELGFEVVSDSAQAVERGALSVLALVRIVDRRDEGSRRCIASIRRGYECGTGETEGEATSRQHCRENAIGCDAGQGLRISRWSFSSASATLEASGGHGAMSAAGGSRHKAERADSRFDPQQSLAGQIRCGAQCSPDRYDAL